MNMREAFEQAGYANEWGIWKAACEWQKQKDAEICKKIFDEICSMQGGNYFSTAILNQGDE